MLDLHRFTIELGHNIVCQSLCRNQADADDGGDKGWTPLLVAAGEGHLDVCQTLLNYNASVHGFLGDGRHERSALQEAAEQGHVSVVALLLENKADPNHACDDGSNTRVTAYEIAQRNNHTKVAQLLAPAM